MPSVACPDPNKFQYFIEGEGSAEDIEAFALHLEQCPRCASAVDERLLPSETIHEAMRGETAHADAEEPNVQRLIEQLQTLLPPIGADTLASYAPLGDPTEADNGHSAGESNYDFLAPPQGPGELGRLGPYRVLKVLGAGGMGVVFEAEDPHLGRLVALKAMRPEVAARPGSRDRFLREARAAAKVKHDHIVTIHTVGEEHGVPFLAIELLEGESLETRLQREGALPVVEAVRIGREMAQGLAAAHKRGLMHRDIKPANLWLESETGRTKILDFGLARGNDEVNLTQSGQLVGTPAYMAPEQGRGEKVDVRCDLFSLGVVLYRMCSGRLPFEGSSTMAILTSLAIDKPASLSDVRKAIPQGVSELVMKLLEKDPAKRFQSAEEVVRAISTLERTLTSPPKDATDGDTKPFERPVLPPKRRLIGVAAAAVIALVATGVVLFWQTPYGTVRIEIYDKDTKVSIEGDAAKIVEKGKEELRLQPGPHGFVVTRGDFSFKTDKLTLAKGDTVTLKVEFIDGKVRVTKGDQVWREESPPVQIAGIVPAASDYALYFNGADAGVEVPSLTYDGSHSITIEARVRLDRTAVKVGCSIAGWNGTFSLNGATNEPWRSFSTQAFDQAGKMYWIDFGVNPQSKERIHHVATVYDGKSLRVYVDGVGGQSIACPKIRNSFVITGHNTDHFAIGCAINIGTQHKRKKLHFHEGLIDELRVSKSARYVNDYAPKERLESDKDTLALFHFDEGQGDKLVDSSGNNHHGKIVGAKWVKADGSPISPGPSPPQYALDFNFKTNPGFARVELPSVFDPSDSCTMEMVITPRRNDGEMICALFLLTDMNLYQMKGDLSWNGPRTKNLSGPRNIVRTPSVVTPGRRMHIAGVSTGREFRLYVDGYLMGKTPLVGEMPRGPATAFLAGYFDDRADRLPFDGLIHEFRYSKTVRYDKDFKPAQRMEADKETFILYDFHEGEGDLLHDRSGNAHHGKIVGAKWLKLGGSMSSLGSPLQIPEPPQLAEWLKGRKILTVSQDGKAQFKTIQAALNALKPGQVVKVIDRGPYRETLVLQSPPENIGLISDCQTVLEVTDWHKETYKDPATSAEVADLFGHRLSQVKGFRFAGFELRYGKAGDLSLNLMRWSQPEGLVIEDCLFSRGPALKAGENAVALRVVWNSWRPNVQPTVVRDCMFVDKLVYFQALEKSVPAPLLVGKNYFGGSVWLHGPIRTAALRHNVFDDPELAFRLIDARQMESLQISNNTIAWPATAGFTHSAPAKGASIRNNILHHGLTFANAAEKELATVEKDWLISHNAYGAERVHGNSLAPRPSDLTVRPQFLSTDPKHPDYLHIPSDSPLATGGAGGAWPNYVGALPPGPAPKEGDWFTRLRERWDGLKPAKVATLAPPINIPEPPPLAEWLKGRTILTVSQDGKGQFKTIQAALDALKPGQVVKVLDRGPYRENLDLQPPNDSGLVSESGTALESPEWKPGWKDFFWAHWFKSARDFRLSGFHVTTPPDSGKEGTFGVLAFHQSSGIVLENCRIQQPSAKGTKIAVNVGWHQEATVKPMHIRECVLDGMLALGSKNSQAQVYIQRNLIRGNDDYFVSLSDSFYDQVVLRNNVFDGQPITHDILFQLKNPESRIGQLEIANNTMLSTRLLGVRYTVPAGEVRILNNLRLYPGAIRFGNDAEKEMQARTRNWQVGYNAHPRPAVSGEQGLKPEYIFPRPSTDIYTPPKFLSEDASDVNYARIADKGVLTTGGAGGAWPSYIGALPPGPAPKEGDWFTRLRERWDTGQQKAKAP